VESPFIYTKRQTNRLPFLFDFQSLKRTYYFFSKNTAKSFARKKEYVYLHVEKLVW